MRTSRRAFLPLLLGLAFHRHISLSVIFFHHHRRRQSSPPVHISKPPLDENRGIDSLRCVLVRKFFSIKLGAKLVEHLDVLCREYCSSSNRISTFPRRRLSSSAPIVGEVLSPVGFELNQARRTGFQPQVARRRAGSCTGHSLGPLKCGLRP
jgi:hypothetical protein